MRSEGTIWAEWPTLAVLAVCYTFWMLGTSLVAQWSLPAAIAMVATSAALHSSLSHEMIHGHPFRDPRWNEALVFPALTLVVPYRRFRDTHLEHHRDINLTDPYDDPESNYMDAGVWETLPAWWQAVLRANNTLVGRMLIGPLIGTWAFTMSDMKHLREPGIGMAYAMHLAGLVPVIAWMAWAGTMPWWAFLLATYLSLSILKIRTFLEHQAHERVRGRTCIVEDRGPLALMFLNNNLHVVHHMHPRVPWFRLPDLYFSNKERYLKRNNAYSYRSYAEVFRRYLFQTKDPVPHPLWRKP